MIVVGIDPSLTCTGIGAIILLDDNEIKFSFKAIKIKIKEFEPADKGENLFTRIDVITRETIKFIKFVEIIYHRTPQAIYVEVPWQYKKRYGKTNTKSLMKLSFLVGAIVETLKEKGYRVKPIPTGGGIPKKQAGYDLLKTNGFQFTPNKGYDDSDALIIALFGGWFDGLIPKDLQKYKITKGAT